MAGDATIDASGGTVVADYGRLTLTIPAGALAAATHITVTAIENNAPGGIGAAYRFEPTGTTFAQPVTVTLKPFAGEAEEVATMAGAFQTSDGRWKVVSDASYDSTSGTYSFTTTHFTDYAFWGHVFAAPDTPVLFSNDTTNIIVQYFEEIPDTDGDYIPQNGTYLADDPSYNWSVNGVQGGDSVNGTVMHIGNVANYQAPATPPSQQPVLVSGRFFLPDGSVMIVATNLHVLAHQYTYEVNLEAISSCPSGATGGPVNGFDIQNPGTLDLTLDSTFNISGSANPTAQNASVSNFVTCAYPPAPTCATTLISPTDGAILSSATGGFDLGLHRLRVQLSGGTWTDTPGWTNCNASTQPEVQEQLDWLAPLPTLFVGYDGEQVLLNGNQPNHATHFSFTLHVLVP